jgi:hypothetical protein
VNVAVGRDTRLSYRTFPSMADGDRNYDATNVSVHLVFTDGSSLSDLRATDQHGFEPSPRGRAPPTKAPPVTRNVFALGSTERVRRNRTHPQPGTLTRAHRRMSCRTTTRLGHVFAATALNLIRIDRWLTGTPLGATRTSHLEALMLAA